MSTIQSHLNNGRLAMMRIVGDSSHNYCGVNGATYLVIYKIDSNYVYVLNPNANTQQSDLPLSTLQNASWKREAHIYDGRV